MRNPARRPLNHVPRSHLGWGGGWRGNAVVSEYYQYVATRLLDEKNHDVVRLGEIPDRVAQPRLRDHSPPGSSREFPPLVAKRIRRSVLLLRQLEAPAWSFHGGRCRARAYREFAPEWVDSWITRCAD